MKYESIEEELAVVAATPGIRACALVSIDDGMVNLSTENSPQFHIIAEASRDYWALQNRNGRIFEKLGGVQGIFVQHQNGIVSVQPCGSVMLLVTLAERKNVNWGNWHEITGKLRKLTDDLFKNRS